MDLNFFTAVAVGEEHTSTKKPDEEQFALTVCKEQAKDINIDHNDVWSFDETEVRVRITTIKLCFLFVHVSHTPLFVL